MIRLLAGGAEQHMQGIADDLGHGAVVGEHDSVMPVEIVVEQRPEHVGFERLDQRGEAGNVGEQRRDLAALPGEIDRVGIAGQPLGQIGREVARQRGVRPLGRRLPPPRLAQHFDMPKRLGDRRLEIGKIDGLGQEIERAAVHRGADVGHVAIGGDDDGRKLFLALLQLLQQRQPVHPRHVDVGDHHVDVAVRLQHAQGLDAVAGEHES